MRFCVGCPKGSEVVHALWISSRSISINNQSPPFRLGIRTVWHTPRTLQSLENVKGAWCKFEVHIKANDFTGFHNVWQVSHIQPSYRTDVYNLYYTNKFLQWNFTEFLLSAIELPPQSSPQKIFILLLLLKSWLASALNGQSLGQSLVHTCDLWRLLAVHLQHCGFPFLMLNAASAPDDGMQKCMPVPLQ